MKHVSRGSSHAASEAEIGADQMAPSAFLLADFEFLREGLRQDQRERLVFLGFALAASSAVLGLLVHQSNRAPSSSQAFILIGIALSIAAVAEVMTIRATIGVASAGHYIRIFIEPNTRELRFQGRNRRFHHALGQSGAESARHRGSLRPRVPRLLIRSSVLASSGLAMAYTVLASGLLLAWFTTDLSTGRETWRSALLIAGTCLNGVLISQLWWTGRSGARQVGDAWRLVLSAESQMSEPRS
ncbi:MAG TPA: hypothetical protein VG188_11455 [Solirubrobacteraceae bacterium]|nr:hypothetical protein [Solirubrobacteraceae bacterium]